MSDKDQSLPEPQQDSEGENAHKWFDELAPSDRDTILRLLHKAAKLGRGVVIQPPGAQEPKPKVDDSGSDTPEKGEE